MALQTNMQRDVLELNMERQLEDISLDLYNKPVQDCTDQELYYVVLNLVKCFMEATEKIAGEKKVYYISAEFLIGKLLSNNLINLGLYDKVKNLLAEKGKDSS